MATGYVLPKVLAEKVVPQMAEFDHGPVDKHLFYSPVHQFPKDFSNEDRSRLTRAYAHAVRDQIIPLYKRLHDFFKNEYVPACRASAGISAVPNGNAFYAHQIKTYEGIHFGCIDPKQVRHCQVFDAGRSCITRALDLPASKTCQSQMGTEISIVCAYIYLVDKGLLVLTRRTGRPALIVQQMAKQPHRR